MVELCASSAISLFEYVECFLTVLTVKGNLTTFHLTTFHPVGDVVSDDVSNVEKVDIVVIRSSGAFETMANLAVAVDRLL